jgi:hypothetical protein
MQKQKEWTQKYANDKDFVVAPILNSVANQEIK